MNENFKKLLIAALKKEPYASADGNFSAEDVNKAAVNAMIKEIGISDRPTSREIHNKIDSAFALIEEVVDEILPARLQDLFGQYAEIRTFPRDAEVVFDIENIGRNRAKLTISRGARGGIYRTARLDNKYFSVNTSVVTCAVSVGLEDILLGYLSLSELWANIVEGFQEVMYKEIFNALATGEAVAGYDRISDTLSQTTTTKASLTAALDKVLPYVKQYGIPTVFGSYAALSNIYNPLATTVGFPNSPAVAGYPNTQDSMDVRQYGFVQVYKGVRLVELPNYLIDNSNKDWFYDPSYVFVLPSGIKPVKVALKGDTYIKRNQDAVGGEKWEAHKLMGVGLAMANNYAVIQVTDLD